MTLTNETGFYSTEAEIYFVTDKAVYLVSSPSYYTDNCWEVVKHLPANAIAFDEVLNADVVESLASTIEAIELFEQGLES
jgi:hypothetical protein